jgi:hypothetical protein
MKGEEGCVAAIVVVLLLVIAVMYVVNGIMAEAANDRQVKILAKYKSPVDRTDTQRLDWIAAHPKSNPWANRGSDPRKEIDFAMDQEMEGGK